MFVILGILQYGMLEELDRCASEEEAKNKIEFYELCGDYFRALWIVNANK